MRAGRPGCGAGGEGAPWARLLRGPSPATDRDRRRRAAARRSRDRRIWLRADVTASCFGAPGHGGGLSDGWPDRGLGYTADGELYICGRAKDLIILNGKNYYPQDIEHVVSRVEGTRDGQCVAFSRLDPTGAEVAWSPRAKSGPAYHRRGDRRSARRAGVTSEVS
jgi:acyl-CoA synthetase (AMP-forming)/AMP-acid ligase II